MPQWLDEKWALVNRFPGQALIHLTSTILWYVRDGLSFKSSIVKLYVSNIFIIWSSIGPPAGEVWVSNIVSVTRSRNIKGTILWSISIVWCYCDFGLQNGITNGKVVWIVSYSYHWTPTDIPRIYRLSFPVENSRRPYVGLPLAYCLLPLWTY